jgi:von Willebrand factor A domain-containing protein 8
VVASSPSPLVIAATEGHVLVIDEADKAPTEVIAILKSLIDGDMLLPDGRRLQRKKDLTTEAFSQQVPLTSSTSPRQTLAIHPNFRLIVLVNRPGWPFMGNDFFGECGDLFSVHILDNPDLLSEVNLLSSYAPNVPREILKTIANVFAELRGKTEKGLLGYPYSTREAVQVARHLQNFPSTPLFEAFENVFSFDEYDVYVKKHIYETLSRFGVMSEGAKGWVNHSPPTIEYFNRSGSSGEVSEPKRGKDDPDNAPHVGGNTWAGGTGGRDTAGLGGKGGPYRLSKGHPIHQISEEEKKNISQEAEERAREMGQRELQLRLKEIELSSYDNKAYISYLNNVQQEISQLRSILADLQSRGNDRIWVRNRNEGDFDDSKIVEGAAGERNIYKRREETLPDPFVTSPRSNDPTHLKKKILFVMDCSGSMYYFNGYDGRLDRLMEASTLIMESFSGCEDKIDFSFIGHSGDSASIPLLPFSSPPKTRAERLRILQTMYAHTQYCRSGDNTLRAAKKAIEMITKEPGESYTVILISDANLQRYGISPDELARVALANSNVSVSCILISSLWAEAKQVVERFPRGRAHVCLETAKLPSIMNSILKSTIL